MPGFASSLIAPRASRFFTWPAQSEYRAFSTRQRPLNVHTLPKSRTRPRSFLFACTTTLLVLGGAGVVTYHYNKPFRHACLAGVRCSRVAKAVVLGIIDYKLTFWHTYKDFDEERSAVSGCHLRSANRVLRALMANGGIFIKLGQHISSLVLLPREWTSTMRPLQDKCHPTEYDDIKQLFIEETGQSIDDIFSEFNPKPLGVASLAQVHLGRHRGTGKEVAVKVQHPHLIEFCDIDLEMVEVSLGWVKYLFPEFEFSWLGEEMRENLPKEMDFIHEAANAARVTKDFEGVRTSLYIPEVISASKRILIMEFIQGGRVDDLEYLAAHNIDRNKVALEIQRIFCRMVHLNGWFHADPHPGNLLIRPVPPQSKSPYDFEVVLLDHGLYFDLDSSLRVNYSKFWLSLIATASPSVNADRRKYAQLVGNIDPEQYPIFETAITGRAGLEGAWETEDGSWKRPASLIDMMPTNDDEMEIIRNAVFEREGLLVSVFDILRRVPRRVLMVLKLNDLVRGLDHSLATTHSSIRIFLITARYCGLAVWLDDWREMIDQVKENGLSIRLLGRGLSRWWTYEQRNLGLRIAEGALDFHAWMVKTKAWVIGLCTRGWQGAHLAAAGLA